MITYRVSLALAFSFLLTCAPELTGQADSRPTSQPSRDATARKPKRDARIRLRELLDRADPPASVEIDGRIYEVKKLQEQARDLWEDAEKFNEEQLGAATVETLVLQMLKQKMAAAGHYLSDKAFEKKRQQHEDEYDGTLFNVRTMAMMKGYPSLNSYWAWYRLKASLGQSIEKDLTKKTLKKFLPEVESFLALDQVQVRAMFFSARDDEGKRWEFDRTYKKAAVARARVVKGEDFAKVARQSDPLPKGHAKSKLLNYNLLRGDYRDTKYGELIAGSSPFTTAFYHTKLGDCTQPVLGKDGYWIVKVEKRKRTGQKIQLAGSTTELLRKMYVHDRFQKWVTATLDNVVLKMKPR